MAENPTAGFSVIEVHPVIDLQESIQCGLQIAKVSMEAMSQMGGG